VQYKQGAKHAVH